MLKLHEAMKTLFEEQGCECVKNVKLANMLTDLTSFKNMPSVKNAIEQLVKGGYGEKLYRLYQANNPSDLEIQKYKNDLSIKYGLNPAVVGYVFDCIAYGLGWRTDDVAIPDFSKSNQMDDELLKQKLAEQKAALLAQAKENDRLLKEKLAEQERKLSSQADKRLADLRRQMQNKIDQLEQDNEELSSSENNKKVAWILIIILISFFALGYLIHTCSNSDRLSDSVLLEQGKSQCDSLCNLLDQLPIPTKRNYKEVEKQLLSVSWKNINCDDSGLDLKINFDVDNSYKGVFLQKKRAIAQQIYAIYKEKYGDNAEKHAPDFISMPSSYLEN